MMRERLPPGGEPATTVSGGMSRVVLLAGLYALLGGAVTLIGWFAGVRRLTDWDGSGISMFANTAVAVACAGAALLLAPSRQWWARTLVVVFGLTAGGIAGATLFEHLTGKDLGIDTRLIVPPWENRAAAAPGRMGPPASTCLSLIGLALLLTASSRSWRGRRAVPVLGTIVAGIALLSLLGHLFEADPLFALPQFTGIAMQTASILLALGVGVVAAVPEYQPARTLASNTAAGLLAKCALPIVIAMPVILGVVLTWGQDRGLYDHGMGRALLIISLIVLLCGLLWWGVVLVAAHEQALARRINEQFALFQFTDQLQRAASMSEVYQSALDAIVGALACPRASILRADEAGVMRFVAWRGLSERYRKAVEGHSPWKRGEKDPRPICIADTQLADLPQSLTEVFAAEGIRALAFIPLLAEGQLVGKFMAYYNAPHEVSEQQLSVAVTLGRQLGFALERKRVERERRRAELRFKTIVEACPSGIVMVDGGGKIVLVNSQTESMFGYARGELIGRPVELLIPERFHKGHPAFRAGFFADPQARPMGMGRDLFGRRRDGSEFPVEIGLNPIETEQGMMVVSAIVDIGARKEAEAVAQKARQTAEAASKAKDHFLALLSHELRTPLSPVVILMHTLAQDPRLPAEVRANIQTIRRNLDLEVRLIDDLLDLTRISRGKLTLRSQATDLHALVRASAEMCRDDFAAGGLEVKLGFSASRSTVSGDPVRLQQMIWNLLRNSLKFTPAGGMITLTTSNVDDRIALRVQDTGIGMEPEALARIFRPFEQASAPVSRQFGGLGVGLALTRAIVEGHGGTVSADSAGRGRGSVFTVTLPLTTQQVEKASPPRPPTGMSQEKPVTRRAAVNGLKILLVEDHADTAKAMSLLLSSFGWRVRTADTVASALRAADEPFDVLLCDVGLPDGTGLDLMRQLLTRGAKPIKAVALSGFGMEQDVQLSRDAGFAAHLVKPVNVEELHATIQRVAEL